LSAALILCWQLKIAHKNNANDSMKLAYTKATAQHEQCKINVKSAAQNWHAEDIILQTTKNGKLA